MRNSKHSEVQAARVRRGFLAALTMLACTFDAASAQDSKENPFPNMAPVQQYRIASKSAEIALARSAAPTSISSNAEILVLGDQGYEVAVPGKNGFVCLVERSWLASFDDPVFWNPHIRGPDCLNPAAVRTVLPLYKERTEWVLSGTSKTEMVAKANASRAAHQSPAPGAMGYMMSKQGHLSDVDGHWHPHLMLFQPHAALSEWGANLPGSPLLGQEGGANESTVLFIPLAKWSDGTSAMKD
jgi:hypothetical protein